MKSIEEQIAGIIGKAQNDQREACIGDDAFFSKMPLNYWTNKILSEVTIEVECPECNGWGWVDIPWTSATEICKTCKGTSKITKTLREAIEGMK